MKKRLLFLIPFLLFLFAVCEKGDDDEGGGTGESLVFTSLLADNDSVALGQKIGLKAVASGYKLTYLWKASLGDIFANGNSAEYSPTPCSLGKVTVTCTVTDGNKREQTKNITLVVY